MIALVAPNIASRKMAFRIGFIKLAILFVLVMIHTKLETRKVNI
ncbi:hypothetical protein EMIT019CA3_10856 [Bacillus pseudomycoides]|jgi:hypothetical protein